MTEMNEEMTEKPTGSKRRLAVILLLLLALAVAVGGMRALMPELPADDTGLSPAAGTLLVHPADEQPEGTADAAADHAAEPAPGIAQDPILYSFEISSQGWGIPEWARLKPDHVATTVDVARNVAHSGAGSLRMMTDFSGQRWNAALVELQQGLDMSQYDSVSIDCYLPPEAPSGLTAQLILTVGENWTFTEMKRGVPLVPGEWTTVTADIRPGSADWKGTVPDTGFARDVRKVAVRVVANGPPRYAGPVYIDNMRGNE